MSSTLIQDRSLLVVIIDITPLPWLYRMSYRRHLDDKRAKSKKPSIGPGTLTLDVLPAILTFLLAYGACHRENALVVIGVAGDEVAVVYPRKGVGMEKMLGGDVSSEGGGGKIDPKSLEEGLKLGVTELMARAEVKSNANNATVSKDENGSDRNNKSSGINKKVNVGTAAMTAATSQALCIINRFLQSVPGNAANADSSLLNPQQDEGVLALIANRSTNTQSAASHSAKATEQRRAARSARGILSPRILLIQASEDRVATDYNAFMNCVFAASKMDIVIDGCFLQSGIKNIPSIPDGPVTSPFLEMACDMTGGVYSKPNPKTQIQGGLSEIFLTVFLPPLGIRKELNLLKIKEVDFKARCFETGESLKEGVVCSLCLSIFKEKPEPGGSCWTCGAVVGEEIELLNEKEKNQDGDEDEDGAKEAKRARLET